MSTAALYTPEVLALATGLAQWPLDAGLPLRGEARSPVCGSEIAMGLALDPAGAVERLGLRVRACAVGQAAAALFADAAIGLNLTQLATTERDLRAWLDGSQALPDWPGLEAIAAARAYPGRHGAILLPWRAAIAALSSD